MRVGQMLAAFSLIRLEVQAEETEAGIRRQEVHTWMPTIRLWDLSCRCKISF
jgi:hypothetical protein